MKSADLDGFKMWIRWSSGEGGWVEKPRQVSAGVVFPCFELKGDVVYIWLAMVAHSGVTRRLRCRITLASAEFSSVGRVYPSTGPGTRSWRTPNAFASAARTSLRF
jgi:hypothetical protein